MTFTYIPIIIIIISYIEHCIETFLSNRQKLKGAIKFKWTTLMLLIVGTAVYLGSIIEYIIVNRNINIWICGIGFILLVSRLALKIWAVKTLGKYWSPHVEVRETQKIIKEGPFKYIRHPAYLSAIMEVVGISLVVNAYYVFYTFCVIYFICLYIRINVEEKALIEEFGEEYENYKKNVRALLPLQILKI